MIPERLCQLLTAYIDGELSARQRRAVHRLLRKSPEARQLLTQLQDDSKVLQMLPRPRLDQGVSQKVLRTISERRLQLNRRAHLLERPPFPAWAGYAAAAAVLLVVFCGSYLYFLASARMGRAPVAQHGTNRERVPTPSSELTVPPPVVTPSKSTPEPEPTPVAVTPEPTDPPKKKPDTTVAGTQTPEPSKPPQPTPDSVTPTPQPDALGTASRTFSDLRAADLKLALTLEVKSLEQEKYRKQLRQSLALNAAFRLDMFTLGDARAIERLETAFKAKGVRLVIDQLAQTRLKNRQLKTDYVLYAEELTADELALILQQLGQEDRKNGQLGQLLLLPLSREDHAVLSKLLNVDPTKFDPPTRKIDVRQPIDRTTADELAKTLRGEGVPRPDGKGAVPLTRQALVLSYTPVQTRPTLSREIKLFLENRKPRKPGMLQLLMVIHNAG